MNPKKITLNEWFTVTNKLPFGAAGQWKIIKYFIQFNAPYFIIKNTQGSEIVVELEWLHQRNFAYYEICKICKRHDICKDNLCEYCQYHKKNLLFEPHLMKCPKCDNRGTVESFWFDTWCNDCGAKFSEIEQMEYNIDNYWK